MVTKIIFFTSSLGNGGAEMHLLRLVNHLDSTKFFPILALSRPGGSYESQLKKEIPIHHFNPSWMKSSRLSMHLSIKPLQRLIQKEKPEVVVAVMDHAGLTLIKAVRKLTIRPKILINVQNTLGVGNPSMIGSSQQGLLNKIQKYYPYSDGILALCEGVAEELKSLLPQQKRKISVLFNAAYDRAILDKAKDPLPFPVPKNKFLIVSCGRLSPQKGYQTAIRAAKLLNIREIPFEWWILGEGKERVKLEKQIDNSSLENSVKLLGFYNNPYPVLAAADVFVLPSIWEGFGLVLVEAMACGIPVIATDCPFGPREIVGNSKFGVLTPPENPVSLADEIESLLSDTKRKQQLKRLGEERAFNFAASKISDGFSEIIENLLPSKT